MDEFHAQFPSFDKFYKLQQERKREMVENAKLNQLRANFMKEYPTTPWANLKKQRDDISTDDNCTYWKDLSNGTIYAWDERLEPSQWRRLEEVEAGEVADLFLTSSHVSCEKLTAIPTNMCIK